MIISTVESAEIIIGKLNIYPTKWRLLKAVPLQSIYSPGATRSPQ